MDNKNEMTFLIWLKLFFGTLFLTAEEKLIVDKMDQDDAEKRAKERKEMEELKNLIKELEDYAKTYCGIPYRLSGRSGGPWIKTFMFKGHSFKLSFYPACTFSIYEVEIDGQASCASYERIEKCLEESYL